MIEELSQREEFGSALDMINIHKATIGSWTTIDEMLDPVSRNPGPESDDSEAGATPVSFNQIIRDRIDSNGTFIDQDWFRIDSLTPNGNDGVLTITIEPGHPLDLMYTSDELPPGGSGWKFSDLNLYSNLGERRVYKTNSSDPNWATSPRGGITLTYDLTSFTDVDYYTFSVIGGIPKSGQLQSLYSGSYTITCPTLWFEM